jgi:hypothetical protein
MVNQVLPVSVMLRCIRLGLLMHELPADGVIGVHSARRELLLGLLKGDQQHIGLYVSEVKRTHTGLPSGLQIGSAKKPPESPCRRNGRAAPAGRQRAIQASRLLLCRNNVVQNSVNPP